MTRPIILSLLLLFCCRARAGETNGVILLHSRTAVVHGKNLRYEPQTNKNTLGYWTIPTDWAEWKFEVERPGAFEIEVLQGCGTGSGGSDVKVEAGGQSFDFVVEDTGHFQNFVPRKIGKVHFWKAGEFSLSIKPQNKKAAAVMDVRQVKLLRQDSTQRAGAAAAQKVSPIAADVLSARRIVFLGDSITHSGEYIVLFERLIRQNFPNAELDILNLGLPSETVSGLSEPGHAGGAFPRPDLHERLDRVLAKAKPDLIFACYGMNDGIYYPLSEERSAKFREGMVRLREKAQAAGAKVIHLTPPTFDPEPIKGRTLPAGLAEYKEPFEGYNGVLNAYSEWLLSQRANGWTVIDLHGPMNEYLARKRKADAGFKLAGDGVHAGKQGHWLMARALLNGMGIELPEESSAELFADADGIGTRQALRKDAWLSEIGHKRPGMNKGKLVEEAESEADALALKNLARAKP